MLMARSLWEAETYVSLRVVENAPEGQRLEPSPPLKVGTNMTEGPDAWTYRSPVGEITIPYVSEKTTVQTGAHFGLGRSRLIDAAEWIRVASLYGRRALEDMMTYAGEPKPEGYDPAGRERRYYIELNWELAIDAVQQAMAFLPDGADGADDVPDSELWSAYATRLKAHDEHVLKRARLEEYVEEYRGLLEDFRAHYNRS
jgi:hypothetical protein